MRRPRRGGSSAREGEGVSLQTDKQLAHTPNVRERPILFSAPMLRAILEGRKTQTRRVVKPQPEQVLVDRVKETGRWQFEWGYPQKDGNYTASIPCPFGVVGDRLWVKEGIFTRRVDSPVTLEITNVRVERVQDISDDDALAEGVAERSGLRPVFAFSELWDSINGKKHPWSSNPWVWILEFKLMEPE